MNIQMCDGALEKKKEKSIRAFLQISFKTTLSKHIHSVGAYSLGILLQDGIHVFLL